MWPFGDRTKKITRRARRRSFYRNHLAARLGEPLEARRLLALSAEFADGVLTFTGDGGDNELTITAADNTSTTVGFSSATDTITLIGATNPQGSITSIVVDLAAGGDSLTINGSADADMIAVNGLSLTFGAVPYALAGVENLEIDGQAGADDLSAAGNSVTGTTELLGGAGDDTLSLTNFATGAIDVDGGADGDTIELDGNITAITGSQAYNDQVTLLGPTTISAASGGDTITLNSSIDGAQPLSMHAEDIVIFGAIGGSVPLVSFEAVAGTLLLQGGEVTTTGAQIYAAAVKLQRLGTTTFTGSTATFNGTLDAQASDIEVAEFEMTGDVVFNGAVGGIAPLSNLNVRGVAPLTHLGTTHLNGGLIRTSRGQLYGKVVEVGADLLLDAGAGNPAPGEGSIFFLMTVDGAFDVEMVASNTVNFQGVGFGEAGTVGGTTPLASLTVTTRRQLEVDVDVTTTGDITLTVSDDVNAGQNILILQSIVRSTAGNVLINAGDDFTLSSNLGFSPPSSLFAAGTLVIQIDAASADSTGGTATIAGPLGASAAPNSLVLLGNLDADVFDISRTADTTLNVLGRAGDDALNFTGTDSAETVHVFATQINVAGSAVAPNIIYVEIERAAVNAMGGDDKVVVQLPVSPLETFPAVLRVDGGDGSDVEKITGTTGNDVLIAGVVSASSGIQFQLTNTECLQMFGLDGGDFLMNEAGVPSLLDGGFGGDRLIGGSLADVLFGGGGSDILEGRAGNDFLFNDHDYNFGNPAQVPSNYDLVDGGLGVDTIVANGIDTIRQSTPGDTTRDRVIGNQFLLNVPPGFQADFFPETQQNIVNAIAEAMAQACARVI